MVSCSGSLVQSHCGEGGRCGQMPLACVGSAQCSSRSRFAPLTVCVLPRLHCSGSRLLSRERALRCVRFQFSGPPQKHRLDWACVLCLPRPSSSGSQELDWRTLPGCGAPSPLRGPSLSFRVRQSGVPCVCFGKLISGCDPLG